MQESLILTNIENGIQKVILNRPKKKNAINMQMYKELIKIIKDSEKNESVTMLVITGNGDFFSSGNDFIALMQDESTNEDDPIIIVQNFIDSLILYPKLLIAIVNGPAIGIAATTLALFDIVYASERVYFLTPFCKLGLTAEGCSTYTFPRIMGPSKAGEMLFFGEKLSAHEAARIGFISKVYKADKIHEVWMHLEKVSTLSKESIYATKKLLNRWKTNILLDVNKKELEQLREVYTWPSFAERILSFMSTRNKM